MTDSDPVRRLVDGLLEGAERVDGGEFTLDHEKAAAKRAEFQYADRSAYVIPMAEALLGLAISAKKLAVTNESQDLAFVVDGVSLERPRSVLRDLLLRVEAFAAEETIIEHALGRLAVAIDMAVGHTGVQRVVVVFGAPSEDVVVEYDERGMAVVSSRELTHEGRLEVLVDRPWHGGITLPSAERGNRPELDHLRPAVRYSKADITVNGERISRDERKWDYVRKGRVWGVLYRQGLERSGLNASEIEWWSNGVQVGRRWVEGASVRARVDIERPDYDISRTKVVVEKRLQGVVDELEEARQASLDDLRMDHLRWRPDERPPHWPARRARKVHQGKTETEVPPIFATRGSRFGVALFGTALALGAAAMSLLGVDGMQTGDYSDGVGGLLMTGLLWFGSSVSLSIALNQTLSRTAFGLLVLLFVLGIWRF